MGRNRSALFMTCVGLAALATLAACNGGEFGAHTPDFALPIPLPQPPVIAPSLFLALTRILVMRHSRACSSCSCNILFLCASAWGHWQSTCTRVPVPA